MSTATASFAHEGLGLSLLVPEDWEAEELADNQVRFFGPEHADLDGYRSTLSIVVGEPDGFGDAWFDSFCGQALETLRENYEGFELRNVERYQLSSLAPVNAIWYSWEPEPGTRSSQVQALILVDALRMYLINAATREPIADSTLPRFDEVIRSIRVLPRR